MTDEIITPEPLSDDADVTPSDGGGADKESQDVVSVKDVLSEALGKNFADDETALKAVKDTFAYVGKAGKVLPQFEKLKSKLGGEEQAIKFMEDIINKEEREAPKAPEIDTSKFVPRDEFDRETFFSKNPDYEPHRELISDLKKAHPDKSLADIVGLDSFKTVYDKAKSYDEHEQSKSVLKSNPRLGQVTDKMTKAREASQQGNQAYAEDTAVDAVLDAYERE